MARALLPIALVVGVAFAPVCARAEGQLSLKSVSVDLPPGDDMFPNGPGADAINNNCLACHSADMVLNQPALPMTQWHAEVDKMRTAYKAPIDPKDVDAILDYLDKCEVPRRPPYHRYRRKSGSNLDIAKPARLTPSWAHCFGGQAMPITATWPRIMGRRQFIRKPTTAESIS